MAEDVQLTPNNRTNTNSTTQQTENDKSLPKNKNEEEAYEEIRVNERHILFHFFTLFSISFVCGILLIHLSLWMNSYIHAVTLPLTSFNEGAEADGPLYEAHSNSPHLQAVETYYSSVYTQDETIKDVFVSPFYYTGTYFDSVRQNVTLNTHNNYSNLVIK